MTKILVVSGLGRHWDYSTYVVPDKVGDKVEEMLEKGTPQEAIEDYVRKKSIRLGFTIPQDSKETEEWYHLGTFNILLIVEEL